MPGTTQPAPPADEVVTDATVEGRPLDGGFWLFPGPRSEPRPTVVWDVVCAPGRVTVHARQFGFDPARLVISGGSSGGNLALDAADGPAAGNGASSCGPVATVVPVAVAGTYPAADLVATWDDEGFGGDARPAAQDYLGGTPAEVPDRCAAGPAQHPLTAGGDADAAGHRRERRPRPRGSGAGPGELADRGR